MDATTDRRSAAGPLTRATRRRVLSLLREVAHPMPITEVAERLGLHTNTARLHLDNLADAGLVRRETERREGRGRPRLVYAASPAPAFEAGGGPEDGDQGYRLLAQILTSHLESSAPRPVEEATAAGRSWGRLLARQRRASAPAPTVAAATEELAGLLDDLGFAPGATVPGETLELHRCPFGQFPGRASSVVCAVHLGLMQGALAGSGGAVQATSLEPFVAPQTCLAHFDTTGGRPANDDFPAVGRSRST